MDALHACFPDIIFYSLPINRIDSMKKMSNFVILFFYLIFSVSGIVLVKLGGSQFGLNLSKSELKLQIEWVTILGMVFYIFSFLLWMIIIPRYNLSFIVPVSVGLVQVLVLFAAIFILKEKVSLLNLLGVLTIIVGIILMNIKN
jgi:drug/metabolite transporter (DMT)-like permease